MVLLFSSRVVTAQSSDKLNCHPEVRRVSSLVQAMLVALDFISMSVGPSGEAELPLLSHQIDKGMHVRASKHSTFPPSPGVRKAQWEAEPPHPPGSNETERGNVKQG